MLLIKAMCKAEWWWNIFLETLEKVRLREIVYLIDQRNTVPVYTGFRDEIGEVVDLSRDLHFSGPDGLVPQQQDVKQFIALLCEMTSRVLVLV